MTPMSVLTMQLFHALAGKYVVPMCSDENDTLQDLVAFLAHGWRACATGAGFSFANTQDTSP
jgi:hypothetical protein